MERDIEIVSVFYDAAFDGLINCFYILYGYDQILQLHEQNSKTSQENLTITCFAGLHERAILPEATGRCKRLD